ncbi:MAG: diaminopimelate epimerase, partial [Polyangiaceae bacterium]|nr:diaminopimelate epimerase [Polyangiaceae bacterium]
MVLRFSKYEGIGNDFIVVDSTEPLAARIGPIEAASMCDRHLGIGGDGVLLVGTRDGNPSMKVINADGSIPEMCGNGLRCVVLHLARTGRVTGGRVVVETDAGPHDCVVELDGAEGMVEVAMRVPSLEPSVVPVVADAPLVDAALEVDGQIIHGTAVSMGNPHLVV